MEVFQNILQKKAEKKHDLLPLKMLPILGCPRCALVLPRSASLHASTCSNCGSFYCHLCAFSKMEPFFYYNKKEAKIQEGHDPICTEITALDIASLVCAQMHTEINTFGSLASSFTTTPSADNPFVAAANPPVQKDFLDDEDTTASIITMWRKKNPLQANLPKYLQKIFLGITATHAKELYENVRIMTSSQFNATFVKEENKYDISEVQLDRLNLLCNDEEAKIIIQVKGFF